MVTLDAQNVLLKPSHRKQLMSWLKRVVKLGQKLGNFILNITLHRSGRLYQVQAHVEDRIGSFDCRQKQRDWREAFREVLRELHRRLITHRQLARA